MKCSEMKPKTNLDNIHGFDLASVSNMRATTKVDQGATSVVAIKESLLIYAIQSHFNTLTARYNL